MTDRELYQVRGVPKATRTKIAKNAKARRMTVAGLLIYLADKYLKDL